VTISDVYPLPRIEETLARLDGAAFFSIMDLHSGYWQVPIKESDRPKTAFVTADGLYQFKVMDHIDVYSRTFEEHVQGLRLVLDRLRGANLMVKLDKCEFAQPKLKTLDHIIDRHGVSPDPEKVEAVKNFPRLARQESNAKKLKALRAFLGLLSYYRRFIDGFAMMAKPLHDLVGKKGPFIWTEEAEKSFNTLHEALVKVTRLAYPEVEWPFEIHSDACDYGIGAALVQRDETGERPIAFASRLLTKAERNYSITEKECLALVWAVKKFHCYIWGAEVKLVTDHHALCWLTTKKDLAGRLARWALSVQTNQPVIIYKSGRLHENADALSRYPIAEKGTDDEED
jgi:hypothetical protein